MTSELRKKDLKLGLWVKDAYYILSEDEKGNIIRSYINSSFSPNNKCDIRIKILFDNPMDKYMIVTSPNIYVNGLKTYEYDTIKLMNDILIPPKCKNIQRKI